MNDHASKRTCNAYLRFYWLSHWVWHEATQRPPKPAGHTVLDGEDASGRPWRETKSRPQQANTALHTPGACAPFLRALFLDVQSQELWQRRRRVAPTLTRTGLALWHKVLHVLDFLNAPEQLLWRPVWGLREIRRVSSLYLRFSSGSNGRQTGVC
jgi:hypothetical protein